MNTDPKCFDCNLGFDVCECGTNPSEYPPEDVDALYIGEAAAEMLASAARDQIIRRRVQFYKARK